MNRSVTKKEMVAAIEAMGPEERGCVIREDRIIQIWLLQDNRYKRLEKYQADKPFYLPPKTEVEELSWNGYSVSQKEVQELRSFLRKNFELEDYQEEEMTEEIWYKLNQGFQFHDVMEFLEEQSCVFPSENAPDF